MWQDTRTSFTRGLLISSSSSPSSPSYICWLWLIVLSSCCCLMTNGEFYSSVDSLKLLGNMEGTLIQNYRQYLKTQQQDVQVIRRFIEHIKYHHELAEEDIEDYLGNPINAFTLIKRMVNDWSDVNELLKLHDARNDLLESLNQLEQFSQVDEYELIGAIRGLGRLQDIYQINADDMANGKKYGSTLNWRDCFEIGTTFSDEQNFRLARAWLEISLDKLQDSKETAEIKSTFITHTKEYLAWIYQSLGETRKAIKFLDDIIKENPDHHAQITKKIIINNEDDYDAEDDDEQEKEEGDAGPVDNDVSAYDENNVLKPWMTNYARVCRGDFLNVRPKTQQLKCLVDSKIHPFFVLSPLQIEPILMDPSIILYHNLLNDQHISKIFLETDNRMNRSRVVKGVSDSEIREVRVSQQVWLNPNTSAVVKMMYNLVADITGFDMENAELLQVANYGIGGQYESHHDFLGLDAVPAGLYGDRISTNMFYLSNVEEGGYTIFPNLDVRLEPVKGAMVMWYNLHKSVGEDYRMLHAGCPVLKGSKRIANIWTHAEYQEFSRPCGLENDSIPEII